MIEPVTTLAQLDALDDDLVVAGYRAGRAETPDYTQKSQSYWHGYLNGDADIHPERTSESQRELARVYFARQRAQ
jgi:hypothetical protein